MTENNKFLTRRTVLRSGAVTATVGAVGAGAVVYGSQPALAADTTLGDSGQEVSIQADENGDISAVDIEPTFDISWENFDSTISTANVEVSVTVTSPERSDSTGETITSTLTSGNTVDLDGSSGEILGAETNANIGVLNIIGATDDEDGTEITSAHFPETEEENGFTDPTTVDVSIVVSVDGSEDNYISNSLSSITDGTISVLVEPGSEITVSGDSNLSADSDVDNNSTST
ncbi:hypothetical protein [Natrinema salifodinae]|uniref:Uncharacterized protein n=1 Tax=Natrinema salifodinae TaxID=1202768 RepID=A0A1I0NPR2_9EURY|nr:hypothetical protein [Natrinema salifodinae]SEW03206.1 hypothetical protein SAMN05216285_1959 [Natrinema salifodinae]